MHPDPLLPAHDSSETVPIQILVDYLSQFITLQPADLQAIVQSLNVRRYRKGTLLVREGQYSNRCYFILQGCVRQYYLVDGEERTTNFFTEGDPVAPNEGAQKNLPLRFNLACVEDTILTVGTPEDEIQFFKLFPHLEGLCRIAVEDQLGKAHETFAQYMLNTPEQRYLHLLDTRPDLLDRVPQYQLASYLGVKPESLSRIRKRIMDKAGRQITS